MGGGGGGTERPARPGRAHRELLRLDGNRIWRVETPQGPVLQKLYAERGGAVRSRVRELFSRLRGGKTGTRAAARRATEARLLALWREAGLDVPADLSARHPDLANERTLVLECVPGPLLSELLADRSRPRAERDALLARFARAWSRRHRLARERGEAGLVQEHGGFQHVIVAGERLVTFDLENAFLPRAELLPILAKEIASYLRSLLRGNDADVTRADLAALVAHYEDHELLRAAARHYLENASLWWRAVWAVDRWREMRRARRAGKYHVMEMLCAALDEGRGNDR
jgi:hypothetical protein